MKSHIPNGVLIGLGAVCLLLAGADFFRERHGYFAIEHWPLVYPVFGFAVYVVLLFAAKALRRALMRPEDFYGDHATDQEDGRFAGTEALTREARDA